MSIINFEIFINLFFYTDESTAISALQTLANISIKMVCQSSGVESGLFFHLVALFNFFFCFQVLTFCNHIIFF